MLKLYVVELTRVDTVDTAVAATKGVPAQLVASTKAELSADTSMKPAPVSTTARATRARMARGAREENETVTGRVRRKIRGRER